MMPKVAGVGGAIIVLLFLWFSGFGFLRGDSAELREAEKLLDAAKSPVAPPVWADADLEALNAQLSDIGFSVTVSAKPDGLSIIRRAATATAQHVRNFAPAECVDLLPAMRNRALGEWVETWRAPQGPLTGEYAIGELTLNLLPGSIPELYTVLECLERIPAIRVDTFSFSFDGDGLSPPGENDDGIGQMSIRGALLYRFEIEQLAIVEGSAGE